MAASPHLVQFRREDLFKANVKLRPRLLAELKPGTRVVSHQFDMGTWKPDKKVELSAGRTIYLWTIPPRKRP